MSRWAIFERGRADRAANGRDVKFFGRHKGGAIRDEVLVAIDEMAPAPRVIDRVG